MTLVHRLRERGHPPLLAATLIGGAMALLLSGMYLLLR